MEVSKSMNRRHVSFLVHMNITSQDLYENVSRLKVWPKEKEFATKMDIIESSTTSAVSNTASKPITDFGITARM